jgi:hypothetical protein
VENLNFFVGASRHFFERHLQVIPEVFAAPRATAGGASPPAAKKGIKNVFESTPKTVKALASAGTTRAVICDTELVILGTTLGVGQDGIRLLNFFETGFCPWIFVYIGVILTCQSAIGFFNIRICRVSTQFQNGV